MIPVGKNPKTGLVEIVELKDHPFYVGVQFHPEYKSTVESPHPLFVAFVKAAKEAQEKRNGRGHQVYEKSIAE
jgi:CTP synthase